MSVSYLCAVLEAGANLRQFAPVNPRPMLQSLYVSHNTPAPHVISLLPSPFRRGFPGLQKLELDVLIIVLST
jgi:hypothetical protein